MNQWCASRGGGSRVGTQTHGPSLGPDPRPFSVGLGGSGSRAVGLSLGLGPGAVGLGLGPGAVGLGLGLGPDSWVVELGLGLGSDPSLIWLLLFLNHIDRDKVTVLLCVHGMVSIFIDFQPVRVWSAEMFRLVNLPGMVSILFSPGEALDLVKFRLGMITNTLQCKL